MLIICFIMNAFLTSLKKNDYFVISMKSLAFHVMLFQIPLYFFYCKGTKMVIIKETNNQQAHIHQFTPQTPQYPEPSQAEAKTLGMKERPPGSQRDTTELSTVVSHNLHLHKLGIWIQSQDLEQGIHHGSWTPKAAFSSH